MNKLRILIVLGALSALAEAQSLSTGNAEPNDKKVRAHRASIMINPTNGAVPVRSSETAFSDSPLTVDVNGNLEIGANPAPNPGNGGLTMVGSSALRNFLEIHNNYATAIDLYSHTDAAEQAPYIQLHRSGGSQLEPTPVTYAGYEVSSIGGVNFRGWDGSQYFTGASILTQVDEDWTHTNHGAHLSIYGVDAGSVSHGPQIVQFGGVGPNGEPNTNIITYRGISFKGASSSDPAINNTIGPGPTLSIQRADGSGDAALAAGILIETMAHTPSSPSDTGMPGQIAWDSSYIYLCVAPNTWKRAILSTW